MTQAPHALKIACDNCKQKLYCVNWPLQQVGSNGHFIYVQVLKVIILVLRELQRENISIANEELIEVLQAKTFY